MAATTELWEKLQRQRLRIGELRESSLPSSPTKTAGKAAHDEVTSDLSPCSSDGCEEAFRSELYLKLKRQRRRMGESGLVLKEISNQEAVARTAAWTGLEIDSEVKVRERALQFEGFENADSPQFQMPDRDTLDCREMQLFDAFSVPCSRRSSLSREDEEEKVNGRKETQHEPFEYWPDQEWQLGEIYEQNKPFCEKEMRQLPDESVCQHLNSDSMQGNPQQGKNQEWQHPQRHDPERCNEQEVQCPWLGAYYEPLRKLADGDTQSQHRLEDFHAQLYEVHETCHAIEPTSDAEVLGTECFQEVLPQMNSSQEEQQKLKQGRDCYSLQEGSVMSKSPPGFQWQRLQPLVQDSDDEQTVSEATTNSVRKLFISSDTIEQRKPNDGGHTPRVHATQCFSLADADDDLLLDNCEEPFEFAMLDYLGFLPQAIVDKLRETSKMHEHELQKMYDRNRALRARVNRLQEAQGSVPELAAAARTFSQKAQPSTPKRCCKVSSQSPCSSRVSSAGSCKLQRTVSQAAAAAEKARHRRLLREEMAARVATLAVERTMRRDEKAEANLKAKLERTVKASKNQVLSMQRRAEREDECIRIRFEMAMKTRDGLEQSLKAVAREEADTTQQIAYLEEWLAVADGKVKAEDKDRYQVRRRERQLRCELKGLHARAERCQQRQRHLADMCKEFQTLKARLLMVS